MVFSGFFCLLLSYMLGKTYSLTQGLTKVKIAVGHSFSCHKKFAQKNCRKKFRNLDTLKRHLNEFQREILRKFFVAKLVTVVYIKVVTKNTNEIAV